MKNVLWQIHDLKVIPLIYQIGFRNGLKEGERPTLVEWIEVYQRHPDWLSPLGSTEQDIDMLAGNLREQGFKVLNTAEIQRRLDNEKNN